VALKRYDEGQRELEEALRIREYLYENAGHIDVTTTLHELGRCGPIYSVLLCIAWLSVGGGLNCGVESNHLVRYVRMSHYYAQDVSSCAVE
jgi:hypothetical protein